MKRLERQQMGEAAVRRIAPVTWVDLGHMYNQLERLRLLKSRTDDDYTAAGRRQVEECAVALEAAITNAITRATVSGLVRDLPIARAS
jgi:hypothetical protein